MDLADAEQLCTLLLAEHLPGWSFSYDRAYVRFGRTWPDRRRITLSAALVAANAPEVVRDTMLHEIAHGLTPDDGHGERWRHQAAALGADPKRRYDSGRVRAARPRGRCPSCGATFYRKQDGGACGRCCERHNGGNYDIRFRILWSDAPSR